MDAEEGREQLSPECRQRFLDFLVESLQVRKHCVLTLATIRERAANITAAVEADFNVTLREEPWNGGNESNEGSPGSGSSGPVGSVTKSTATAGMTGSGSRVAGAAGTTQSETMQAHADRVIR